MGTLFWQLNDCWPVVSWSSIDYDGRWKALQYYPRRAYAPMLVSPYLSEAGNVAVKVVSDRTEDFKGMLEAYVMGFDGEVKEKLDTECIVKADASADILEIDAVKLDGDAFLYVRLLEGGKLVSENTFFARYPNSYDRTKAEIEIETVSTGEGLELIVSADRLTRCLYLHTDNENDFIEDNYMDLIPGFPRRISVKTDSDIEKFKTIIKYQTL
jgi:beta-mannosidase